MNIALMRSYLQSKYPGSAWAKRVAKMPDDQVIAIYTRLVEASRKKPIIRHARTLPAKTIYMCLDCFKQFAADNPELSECRFCGGTVVPEEYEQISKEYNNNED